MATKSIPAGSRHDDDNPKTKSPSIPCTTSTRSPSISSTEDSGMVPTSISVIHDTDLFGNRGQMKYLRTYEEEILSLALLYISGTPLLVSPLLCASIEESANTMDKIMLPSDEIKKKHEPFISTPPEIMIGIFKFLNPIDAVCFSLMKFVLPKSTAFDMFSFSNVVVVNSLIIYISLRALAQSFIFNHHFRLVGLRLNFLSSLDQKIHVITVAPSHFSRHIANCIFIWKVLCHRISFFAPGRVKSSLVVTLSNQGCVANAGEIIGDNLREAEEWLRRTEPRDVCSSGMSSRESTGKIASERSVDCSADFDLSKDERSGYQIWMFLWRLLVGLGSFWVGLIWWLAMEAFLWYDLSLQYSDGFSPSGVLGGKCLQQNLLLRHSDGFGGKGTRCESVYRLSQCGVSRG